MHPFCGGGLARASLGGRVWVRPGPQPQSRDCGWATLGMQPVGHRPAGAAPVARASIEFPAAAGSEALIAGRRPAMKGSVVVSISDCLRNAAENSAGCAISPEIRTVEFCGGCSSVSDLSSIPDFLGPASTGTFLFLGVARVSESISLRREHLPVASVPMGGAPGEEEATSDRSDDIGLRSLSL